MERPSRELRGAQRQQATGTSGTIISIGEACTRASEEDRKAQGAQPAGDEIVLSKLTRFNSRMAELTTPKGEPYSTSAQRSIILQVDRFWKARCAH